jgi:hypothetical protein
MATYSTLNPSHDLKSTRSTLNQLVDCIQYNISGAQYVKSTPSFVTGGVGPGVTSSLFQTCYDQDYTLQTANPFMDITCGIFSGSTTVVDASTGVDASGKVLFGSGSIMMREKVAMYREYAQVLLGNADSSFYAPFSGDTSATAKIDNAMFISFKRLFSRDKIKRESFAMRWYASASWDPGKETAGKPKSNRPNIHVTSESGSHIYSDVGSSTNAGVLFGGDVGNIVDASNTSRTVGLIFYQQGTCVFDLEKITSASQCMSGTLDAVTNSTLFGYGKICMSSGKGGTGTPVVPGTNANGKLIPDMMVSGSMDALINHFRQTRFQSGSDTAITFQNLTNINSTLVFCRATADQFNYSSNPTYVNPATQKINVIESGQEFTQKAFSYITTVGLYDENDNLIACAKMSRPIEKNNEKDITIRVRLDF